MTGVLDLLGPIVLIGLADSINPATIALAVLVAAGERPRSRLLAFTLGTGLTYFAGGLILTLGPAALLKTLAQHRPDTRTYIAAIVVGVVALGVAAWVWRQSSETVTKRLPTNLGTRGAFGLGAGMTLVDLPTALPYFAAIALIVAASLSVAAKVTLLAAFNVAYIAPLLAMTAAVALLGPRAAPVLVRVREWVEQWGNKVLAGITAVSGIYLIVYGTLGLA